MRHRWLLALLCMVMILWGCDHTIPIPPDITFNNPTPQWSWTGSWLMADVGSFPIVQNGEDLSGTWGHAPLVGKVTGNVGTGSIGQHPFTFVMSDDGMYLKGEITGTEVRNLKRESPPIALLRTRPSRGRRCPDTNNTCQAPPAPRRTARPALPIPSCLSWRRALAHAVAPPPGLTHRQCRLSRQSPGQSRPRCHRPGPPYKGRFFEK